MTETKTSESFQFKAEVQQLLNILVHSLYTDQEIFLRELISNASDALSRVQFEMLTNHEVLDPDAELGIWITTDEEANTITIKDTGIGMSRDELISNLGTIARSGAADFLKQIKESKDKAGDIIGQFGVGFYSVFMVAKEVEVISHSYKKDTEAVRWISDGSETYRIEPAEKTDRGTTIIVKLTDETKEFAQQFRLQNIVKKHSDFVNYPIYIDMGKEEDDEEPQAANQRKALWRQNPTDVEEEKYKEFYRQLTLDFEEPLTHLHLKIDAPVQVRAMLFIPAHREGNILSLRKEPGLKLYSHNVLIEEYTIDLLPNHFRFIHGVVDSEDISLSVSRESVQNTRVIGKLKNLLTKRVVRMLEDLDKESPEKYTKFWKEFGAFIKEGLATDPTVKDGLTKLLRFPCSTRKADELISLPQYIETMPEDQEVIYYLAADSIAAANNSPHMDTFKKRDISVLYFTDALDSFMLNTLQEFDGKKLQNVESAKLEETEEEAAAEEDAKSKLPDEKFAEIITRFKSVLNDKVEDVKEAKRLSASPVRLVAPEGAQGQEMDRVRRMLDQDYEVPKRILEINRGHPLIQNLANHIGSNTTLADLLIEQLFDSALLSEGLHPNPAEMLPRIQELMEIAGKA